MSDEEGPVSSPPVSPSQDELQDDNNSSEVWTEYQDDEGKSYFYNSTSGETQWEPPPGAIIKKGDDLEAGGDDNDVTGDGEALDETNEGKENDGLDSQQDENENGEIEDVSGGGDATMAAAENEWTKYQDDEGRDYYYNANSGETQWDRPDGFVDDDTPEPDGNEDAQVYVEGDQGDKDDKYSNEPGGAESEVNDMETTTTDMDLDADDAKQQPSCDSASDQIEDVGNENIDTGITSRTGTVDEEVAKSEEDEKNTKTEPQSPPKDPREVAIENSLSFLNKPDAVMEPNASAHLFTLVHEKEAEGAQMAIKSLSSSFYGQTAICGVLSRWLVDLKTANEKDSNTSSKKGTIEAFDLNKLHQANAETIRQLIEQVIARTAKAHFTDEAQQRLFDLSRKERQFFDEMMEHERWRRLLIDLSAQHKDSALLTLLLQSISKRGYHREIAKRMDQSDFFEVFHGMLSSELLALGKLSVNGGKASAHQLNQFSKAETIVSDLKRQCTSTEYTYVYIIELLNELIARAKAKLKMLKAGPKALGLARATRKWERLREEIKEYMIKPHASSSLNPLSKKRRADISLTSSELYQRQRRRVRILNQTDDSNGSEQLQYSVESGILNALKKYSRDTSIDDSLVNQLLYNPYTDKSKSTEECEAQVGTLLHGHPLSIEYLLRILFLPGVRVKSSEMRMKCSKLVAMAVVAAQKEVVDMSNIDISKIEAVEIETVASMSKMILKGSQLCEQVENIVKFVVSEDARNSSVGTQISNLCIKCSTIAQGFLMWARARSSNADFSSTAAYPYTAPGILSLVRIIASHHPLQRSSAIEVALIFFGHTSKELSYQKMNAIKEQAVRLLLIIATKGLAVDVFNAVASTLKSGRSAFDSGLIRYFISGALEIMRPPFSVGIVQSMGSLLLLSPCTEALNAVYFDSTKKQKLHQFIGYFMDAVSDERRAFARCTSRDVSIATALKSAYKFAK